MKINFLDLPQELYYPINEIAPLLSFSIDSDGISVQVRRNNVGPKIIVENGCIMLEYHKIPEFFRMLTMLPGHINNPGIYEEFPAHEDLCLMSDCSRNAVYNIPAAKRMIQYLALMGFTSFMLYTEDTYEVPEYPFFGYMRGRFTQDELKELDDYANSFGIEMIPCIQVLAHLNGSIHWPVFNEMHDVADILLVGEENTYELIDAMIKSCRACFRTKRIHIGMDEAHLLGSGKYLDKHGYRNRSEIILEHLNRVVKICEKYCFAPMMWSDMFFRIQFHTYYIEEGEISPDVIKMVPKNLSLVYWDYYNNNEELFRHMIHCHKQFKRHFIFAGGAWKWGCMSPCNYYSLYNNDLQLRIAKEERVPMVIATAWGDNGAEASNFSIMAVLQQYAEYCYAKGEDREWLKERFAETFQMSFDDFMMLDTPNQLSPLDQTKHPAAYPKKLLYNDPLGGWLDYSVLPEFAEEYAKKEKILKNVKENQFSYQFKSAAALCGVLKNKATLSFDIRKAYKTKDLNAIKSIVDKRIPTIIKDLETYLLTIRNEWNHDNKSFGFEVIELRIGGLKERLRSTQTTLIQYLNGAIDKIERLEEKLLVVESRTSGNWSTISNTSVTD